MATSTDIDVKKVLNLGNITQLTTFIIAVTVAFALVRLYFFYVLLLHVPIFQYFDLTDIVLMVPSGIFWTLYVGSVESAKFILETNHFQSWQKYFYSTILYSFALLVVIVAFRNDPIIDQDIRMPFHFWYIGIVPFVIYITARIKAKESKDDFFTKNRYVAVFILAMWYAVYESFANYQSLQHSVKHNHIIFRLRDGNQIKTNNEMIYAGRSKNYWFIYNRKTEFIRVYRNDDITIVDFDTLTK